MLQDTSYNSQRIFMKFNFCGICMMVRSHRFLIIRKKLESRRFYITTYALATFKGWVSCICFLPFFTNVLMKGTNIKKSMEGSSLLIFFRCSFSGLLGINHINQLKMAQKVAFFEIFKPTIWAQLCTDGNCPCTKSLLFFWIRNWIFSDLPLKWFLGNKPHNLTQ